MLKLALISVLSLGLFSCATSGKNESSKVGSSDSLLQNRHVANDAEMLDANKYASVILCKFGIMGSKYDMQVEEHQGKWDIIFSNCGGPLGGEYKVIFTQNKYFNLDFLFDKEENAPLAGGMALLCVGQNTVGTYNVGQGVGLGFLLNVEAKQFISTQNKSTCYVPLLSIGLQGGAEWSPYQMRIEKRN